MTTDPELLQSYATGASEEAFAELVRRHVGLVYGVALRQVGGDAGLAQDVTQAVFLALAAKARGRARIDYLAGWLHGTTRFTASHTVRAERRRQERERKAQIMHDLLSTPEPRETAAMPPEVLDTALGKLDARDREAILLRFYGGHSFLAVGAALRVSEDAARVRVARALEKIRAHFARVGITSCVAAVEAALASQAVAAPPALAATIATAAAAGTAALSAPAVAKFSFLAFMTTTTSSTPWVAGAVAMLALGFAGYEYREASHRATAAESLAFDLANLKSDLTAAEQRAAQLTTRATQAELRTTELERKLQAAPLAPKPALSAAPARPAAPAANPNAEKMLRIKPELAAGMPIKGAVVVFVDGKPQPRPVEFVIGKETRIEAVDDGTYSIFPTLNADGSVKYQLNLLQKNAKGEPQTMTSVPSVTQTPWGAFTIAISGGHVLAFDSDLKEPELAQP